MLRFDKSHKSRKIVSSAIDRACIVASNTRKDIITCPALLLDPVVFRSAGPIVIAIDPEVFFYRIVSRGVPQSHRRLFREAYVDEGQHT